MNKSTVALLSALAIVGSTSFFKPAVATEKVERPFEWTIQIDTSQLKNQFQYNSSELKETIKAKLSFYKISSESEKTPYEDIWYAKAKTLGMERHNKLETTPGDAIAIKVVHSGEYPSYDEQRAAGKAVMKAVLDASLHKNMIATIKVPMTSFHTIVAEIQNYHFYPTSSESADNPIDSDLNLFVESEPAGMTQSLMHLN